MASREVGEAVSRVNEPAPYSYQGESYRLYEGEGHSACLWGHSANLGM